MELTYHTDYAFKVLMYTGANPDRLVTLREVSVAYGISKEHLRKVVHRLAQHGYLSTVKGRSGGLTLNREPASIRVGEVVQLMETTMAIVNCHHQSCSLTGDCALKDVFDRGRQAFLDELNQATLADILGEKRTFKGIRVLSEAV